MGAGIGAGRSAVIPAWLHVLAILSIAAGLVVAAGIAWDVVRHPQRMWIMNLVWPVTALFGSVLALWGYARYGRRVAGERSTPFPAMVGKAACHCGSGCTLGDLVAEWLAFTFPSIAVWMGWGSLFAEKMFAVWILDYVFAFGFGIAFQYFTIKPMRGLSAGQGLAQAAKADALSLTAWQIGMYGVMAIAQFAVFRPVYGVRLDAGTVEFWFVMQLAMLAGLLTSYPVNWWLLKRGIKERM